MPKFDAMLWGRTLAALCIIGLMAYWVLAIIRAVA